MKTRIVDLTKPIQYNTGDPWFMRVKIKHKAHRKSHWLIRLALRLPSRLFPKNWTGWADDTIKNMGLHATTHIDAPWHYGPVVEGKPAKTIDQIPLEWCYGDAIVIDCTHKQDFVAITVDDLKNDLDKNGIIIQEGNIVLIRTDRDKMMGTPDFVEKGTGMSKEATEWLIDQGVKVMGIDQWGWDLPLKYMARKAKEMNDPEFFWEGHRVGIEKEYLHIEQLTNLSALPPSGFKICVFPLKIVGGSAAPARVVAMMDA
ncbi:MAG: cyclase family protein [Chryseobacterium sp.]|uniref:cyclase family protein n=1 Tax=Chryseobacterium sp. TaxID=1871047 RepID=UPI0025C58E01|nr:cyclase family protein [Chryseobacterium sp.]MCJ7932921.1 cyclase family protein [Chryseobacterium sp.]